MLAEIFPDAALDPVTRHGAAGSPYADRKTEARMSEAIRFRGDQEQRIRGAQP